MTRFYLLCFVFFTTFGVGRSLLIPIVNNLGCSAVEWAVRSSTIFRVDEHQQIIQWFRPGDVPNGPKKCSCEHAVMGLGDVSRIQVAASLLQPSSSVKVCAGCLGAEVPVTDYLFSSADPISGLISQTFGPCPRIKVFRCSCPASLTTTTTRTTTTTKTTTKPITTTKITTTSVDPTTTPDFTVPPTAGPMTDTPTESPFTVPPTESPFTHPPTESPFTDIPTESPFTVPPTAGPRTISPTPYLVDPDPYGY